MLTNMTEAVFTKNSLQLRNNARPTALQLVAARRRTRMERRDSNAIAGSGRKANATLAHIAACGNARTAVMVASASGNWVRETSSALAAPKKSQNARMESMTTLTNFLTIVIRVCVQRARERMVSLASVKEHIQVRLAKAGPVRFNVDRS